jgi:hypothetical protein
MERGKLKLNHEEYMLLTTSLILRICDFLPSATSSAVRAPPSSTDKEAHCAAAAVAADPEEKAIVSSLPTSSDVRRVSKSFRFGLAEREYSKPCRKRH